MNIDDYMDMQHDLAEADVIAFENEIDFLHKVLELACKELGMVYGDKGKGKEYWMHFLWQEAMKEE